MEPTKMATPAEQKPDEALIASVKEYVQEYMSHYDPSHDYKHIQRVLRLSHFILAQERADASSSAPQVPDYDDTLVTLGALLHDVGDKKYLAPGQDASTLARDVLLARGCPPALAARAQELVLHVSFSAERRDPGRTRAVVAAVPELAVVQDADRLDALGAVGVARCFAFTGAKDLAGTGLDGAVGHFVEKLERLEGMMKTAAGRRLARERTERIKTFRGWWEEENQGLS